MDKEIVKANCDFCGEEIECPKDMLEKAKKHMCHKCFLERTENGSNEDLKDVHVDYPVESLIEETASNMVNQMIDEVFPLLWKKDKQELKELSKKDLAYEMFGAGAYIALSTSLKLQYEQSMKMDEEAQKENGSN